MIWRLLADATVAVHYAFLVYLLVGGFLAWRWPRGIVVHVGAAIWALLIVVVKVQCPLTWAQNRFRAQAGLSPVDGGFIAHYVRGVVYPAGAERLSQVVVGVVVLVSWCGLVVVRRRRSVPATAVGRAVAATDPAAH